jgi:hypothetical protein
MDGAHALFLDLALVLTSSPLATTRMAMSRSVITPRTAPEPSTTGTNPTSFSAIRRAASCTVASRPSVATPLVMISSQRILGLLGIGGSPNLGVVTRG